RHLVLLERRIATLPYRVHDSHAESPTPDIRAGREFVVTVRASDAPGPPSDLDLPTSRLVELFSDRIEPPLRAVAPDLALPKPVGFLDVLRSGTASKRSSSSEVSSRGASV
ncbi:MAG: hypothetical protein AAGB34_11675, partial [Planctomycetota bacterium]